MDIYQTIGTFAVIFLSCIGLAVVVACCAVGAQHNLRLIKRGLAEERTLEGVGR